MSRATELKIHIYFKETNRLLKLHTAPFKTTARINFIKHIRSKFHNKKHIPILKHKRETLHS